MSAGHSAADCSLGALGEGLAVDVLGDEAGDVAVVAGDVLLAHLVLVARDPGRRIARAVPEDVLKGFVFRGHVLQGDVAIKAHGWRFWGFS